MPDMTRLSICFSMSCRGKEEFWVQILYHLTIIPLNLFSQPLIAPGLNGVLPKTEIITYGIAATCAPRAFGLFRRHTNPIIAYTIKETS